MADILITRGKLRSYITGTSIEGTKWLQQNIDFKNRLYNSTVEVVMSVNTEYIDEFVKDLTEQTELQVDEQ
jgi:hypothetical protein